MVRGTAYVPARGDVVWITLNPQAGHEQAGRCPAVVLSPRAYNAKVGLAVLCPVTSRVKGYPFEVARPARIASRRGRTVRPGQEPRLAGPEGRIDLPAPASCH